MVEVNESGAPQTDTSDMLAVHQVFRDALEGAPDYIGTVEPGDALRSAVVGSYYYNVLRFLEVHHSGEDELVTPLLVERCTPEEVELVRTIASQHHAVEAPVESAHAVLGKWTADADAESGAELTSILGELGEALVPHLDAEEAGVLPLAADHLSGEEWGALPGHGLQHFAGDNVWLILGLIRESLTEEHRQHMLTAMPPPVVEAWNSVGEGAYLGFMASLRQNRV
ncbi:MAG: hemerythrin domain-containing protein [Acidimicrobiales bacterium]